MTTNDKKTPPPEQEQSASQKIQLREGTSLKELAMMAGIKAKDLIEHLHIKGLEVNVNDQISESFAQILSELFQIDLEMITHEEEVRAKALENEEELVTRPPVVTIMGHVDHGKTTLLDAIRESNLVNKESGGITQHIGAYHVVHKDKPITFIDTPGHEAFTQLRARGAHTTDIVVLIVAADDGVMPQTKEAIDHARAAGVPIIVAINKVDKVGADPDKAKQQLSKEGLLVEDWGGEIVSVNISAKEKTHLEELLEMIQLSSEMLELKGNPKVPAQGVVLEARLDAQKGPLATVIIQHGTLEPGQAFISGTSLGKVRALFDETGKPMKRADMSMPVEILGFTDVPQAGDIFQVVTDMETAKKIIQFRQAQNKVEFPETGGEHLTLDQLFQNIEAGETKELPLIIKADVHGSMEVLKDVLPNLSTEQVEVKILHAATGKISEHDINLASASQAIILGYNVKPSQNILDLAKKENVEIRTYSVIYQLTEDIKNAMTGLLDPIIQESYLGRAEIRRVFQIPRTGPVAGCYVLDGKITRNAQIRILRNEQVIHEGRISSLKHLKNNVTEVTKEYECGIGIEKFRDIQEGDIIEAYITEKVSPV
jgi:translation initiation factor IF-2